MPVETSMVRSSADRSAPGGAGISLTIARSIARRHGGDVEASSPGRGEGSTFTVVIPTLDGGGDPRR
jgi:signal transduction histidine kinase